METGNGVSSPRGGRRTNLQSMDDFITEENAADARKAAEHTAYIAANPTKKQKKMALQPERDRLESERKAKKAALEAEKHQAEQRAGEAVKELGVINWVGTLLEYRNANPKSDGGLTYTEVNAGLVPAPFGCTVLLHETPHSFGGGISFTSKKDAKRYASKKAVDWLVGNGYMPSDGSVKFPKAPPPPVTKISTPVQPSAPAGTSKAVASTSYAAQVPPLCTRLGFSPPTYEIKKDSEAAAFWSGYAHFGGDPRIEGKIGEVKGVYGKTNAKEQIAIEVLSFLKDIERQRMDHGEQGDDGEEEGRKRKRESALCS